MIFLVITVLAILSISLSKTDCTNCTSYLAGKGTQTVSREINKNREKIASLSCFNWFYCGYSIEPVIFQSIIHSRLFYTHFFPQVSSPVNKAGILCSSMDDIPLYSYHRLAVS